MSFSASNGRTTTTVRPGVCRRLIFTAETDVKTTSYSPQNDESEPESSSANQRRVPDSSSPDGDLWLNRELRRIEEENRKKWDFDFGKDEPETSKGREENSAPGCLPCPKYRWTEVQAKDVPSLYRPQSIPHNPKKTWKNARKRKSRKSTEESYRVEGGCDSMESPTKKLRGQTKDSVTPIKKPVMTRRGCGSMKRRLTPSKGDKKAKSHGQTQMPDFFPSVKHNLEAKHNHALRSKGPAKKEFLAPYPVPKRSLSSPSSSVSRESTPLSSKGSSMAASSMSCKKSLIGGSLRGSPNKSQKGNGAPLAVLVDQSKATNGVKRAGGSSKKRGKQGRKGEKKAGQRGEGPLNPYCLRQRAK